ncbi:MAG TPA: hypothetical protein VK720_16420 [Terracidiphilus sp.]|jgi:hypothetical protein|nr:hypothetical protein [Terracidiphilus sp.]
MKISGVIRFDGLNATGAQILREFERNRIQGLGFTFGPSPDSVVVSWDASAQLPVILRMAELVASRRDSPEGPDFSGPDFSPADPG